MHINPVYQVRRVLITQESPEALGSSLIKALSMLQYNYLLAALLLLGTGPLATALGRQPQPGCGPLDIPSLKPKLDSLDSPGSWLREEMALALQL